MKFDEKAFLEGFKKQAVNAQGGYGYGGDVNNPPFAKATSNFFGGLRDKATNYLLTQATKNPQIKNTITGAVTSTMENHLNDPVKRRKLVDTGIDSAVEKLPGMIKSFIGKHPIATGLLGGGALLGGGMLLNNMMSGEGHQQQQQVQQPQRAEQPSGQPQGGFAFAKPNITG